MLRIVRQKKSDRLTASSVYSLLILKLFFEQRHDGLPCSCRHSLRSSRQRELHPAPHAQKLVQILVAANSLAKHGWQTPTNETQLTKQEIEKTMNFLIPFLIGVAVTAISLLLISKIPFLGVEVDGVGKALTAGVVFGVLNWLLGWIAGSTILNVLTLGILWLIINTIIFGLSAKLVEGFRLRLGIWSAILGAIALTVVNSVLFTLLGGIFRLAVRA